MSPGTYVVGGRPALAAAIAHENAWLEKAGSGRLSLVIDSSWLANAAEVLIAELRAVREPLALAFGDQNDPLRAPRSVRALVRLLKAVPDVMVNRTDVAGFGAVAHGATLGGIGTGTSVRHVVPPGKEPGGSGSGMPSAFVRTLLDFKHPGTLLRLPRGVKPTCDLSCCGGQRLERFAFGAPVTELRHHNLVSLSACAEEILDNHGRDAAGWFSSACRAAVHEAARIEAEAKQPFDISPQVHAWATL